MPNGIADSGSGAPTENPSDTSQAINLDATTRQVGQETTMDPIAASPVTFSLEMPPSDLLFLAGHDRRVESIHDFDDL